MIIKQYTLTLPADYDMQLIRSRVATRGPAFDTLPGLGLKAFAIREKGRFGAASNQYAPIYLWPQVESVWNFVAGPGFQGIVESFGWTTIDVWLGLAFDRTDGADWKGLRAVTRETRVIASGTDLAALRTEEVALARQAPGAAAGRVARAVGIDPRTWSLVRFDYWSVPREALPAAAHAYEVLHVSAPSAAELRRT
jgi:hypothetical protein